MKWNFQTWPRWLYMGALAEVIHSLSRFSYFILGEQRWATSFTGSRFHRVRTIFLFGHWKSRRSRQTTERIASDWSQRFLESLDSFSLILLLDLLVVGSLKPHVVEINRPEVHHVASGKKLKLYRECVY